MLSKAIKYCILFTLSLLVAFFVAEVAFRIYSSFTLNYDVEMYKYAKKLKRKSDIPGLSHEHIPNKSAKLMGVKVSINSMGFRDDELPEEKDVDELRIMVVGSSATMGWGVENDSVFTTLLEDELKTSFLEKQVTVVNAGVGNYNTVLEAILFRQTYERVQPDMVILHYAINDAEDISPKSSNFFVRNSYLVAHFYLKIKQLTYESEYNSLAEYYKATFADDAPGWVASRKAVLEIKSVCEQNEWPFFVIIQPDLHDFSKDSPQFDCHKIMNGFFNQNGIHAIDMFGPYAEASSKDRTKLWVTAGDPHPNALGHQLIFQAILAKTKKTIASQVSMN